LTVFCTPCLHRRCILMMKLLSMRKNGLERGRSAHQTRHAARAVRTRHSHHSSVGPESQSMDANNTPDSVRQSIVKEFYANLKSFQERGVTTGENRDKRWKNGSQIASASGQSTTATRATTATANSAHRDVCFSSLWCHSQLTGSYLPTAGGK
jgi:hypothetical protein